MYASAFLSVFIRSVNMCNSNITDLLKCHDNKIFYMDDKNFKIKIKMKKIMLN